jgi:hypothetical protein
MKRFNKVNLILMSSAFILTGCSQAGAKTDYLTKKHNLASFSKIQNSASIDVDVQVGESQSISVMASQKYLDRLILTVENDTLFITTKKGSSKNGFSWEKNKNKITIDMEELNGIYIQGSSDITAHDVNTDVMTVGIRGSGDVRLDGKCGNFNLSIRGSGDFDTSGFSCSSASVDVRGSGDVYLAGECNDLNLQIMGSGDINAKNYKCSDVTVGVKGSGDVAAYASQSVKMTLRGSGDITIKGNPKSVEKNKAGSGDISVK